ncbi:hypothetical protein D3C84_814130 [compost metagenome]
MMASAIPAGSIFLPMKPSAPSAITWEITSTSSTIETTMIEVRLNSLRNWPMTCSDLIPGKRKSSIRESTSIPERASANTSSRLPACSMEAVGMSRSMVLSMPSRNKGWSSATITLHVMLQILLIFQFTNRNLNHPLGFQV